MTESRGSIGVRSGNVLKALESTRDFTCSLSQMLEQVIEAAVVSICLPKTYDERERDIEVKVTVDKRQEARECLGTSLVSLPQRGACRRFDGGPLAFQRQ